MKGSKSIERTCCAELSVFDTSSPESSASKSTMIKTVFAAPLAVPQLGLQKVLLAKVRHYHPVSLLSVVVLRWLNTLYLSLFEKTSHDR